MLMHIFMLACLFLVHRCLLYIRELLELLTVNIDTIIAREYVAEETENDKFTKVLYNYLYFFFCFNKFNLVGKQCNVNLLAFKINLSVCMFYYISLS